MYTFQIPKPDIGHEVVQVYDTACIRLPNAPSSNKQTIKPTAQETAPINLRLALAVAVSME